MIASVPEAVERIEGIETRGYNEWVKDECLIVCKSFNTSVSLYLGGVFIENVFGKKYHQDLNPFYPFELLPRILSNKAAKSCTSVIHALPYIHLFAKRTADRDFNELTSKEKKEIKLEVVAEMTESGFTGIGLCINSYTEKK